MMLIAQRDTVMFPAVSLSLGRDFCADLVEFTS
jgi:hypothetical protein